MNVYALSVGLIFCAALLADVTTESVTTVAASDGQPLQIESIGRAQLHENIKRNTPEWCDVYQACGTLVRVDCNASLDGIERYFDRSTGSLVMKCGGRCMNPESDDPLDCKACPPKEWERCSAPQP